MEPRRCNLSLRKANRATYLVETKRLREGLSKYYAEISYMDQQVGEVDILREMKQAENTVILWLSEQGSQLPFGKWTCYDMGIHAAAVVRWPGRIKPGSESTALISYVDVVPTFLELAGGSGCLIVRWPIVPPGLLGKKQVHHSFVYAVNTPMGSITVPRLMGSGP